MRAFANVSIFGRSFTPIRNQHVVHHHAYLACNALARQRRHTHTDKPFYVTTPIFYVNAAPHVGHLFSMVVADIIKRWHLLAGRQSLLCTGTDEHGMKIQQAANKAGRDPKTFCDGGAEIFKELAARANVSYDRFIRTTDSDHRDAVQYAWNVLQDKGHIYLSKHEGWYSVSDETFYPSSGVHLTIDPPTGRKVMTSIETGKQVEWTSETNYRFRLSDFRERLLDLYKKHPDFILPQGSPFASALVKSVEENLEDLSVSRPSSRLSWGIPVPTDPSQTIYVWLDALLNYATKTGYPFTPGNESVGGWPADCHVVGKDIIRFHCVYWPAFLMALDLPVPRHVLVHAHWTLGRQKMSKSTGNVVNPFFAIDRFGVDVMRWYMARDGGFLQDADYGNENIVVRYHSDLRNSLGNLVSRVTRGKIFNIRNAVENATNGSIDVARYDDLAQQYEAVNGLRENLVLIMKQQDVRQTATAIIELVNNTNTFMQNIAPWELAKSGKPEDKAKFEAITFLLAESVRIAGICLQPFMPERASRLLDMLGVDAERRSLEFAQIGQDSHYGTSTVELGKAGPEGTLFPPLVAVG